MSEHVKKAMKLRSNVTCPNCAETILLTYAKELGLTKRQAVSLGTNLGGGMKSGSVCGAVTSALLVLGALGVTDPKLVGQFQNRVKERHGGTIDCADLLKANFKAGGQKKPHCDAMIREAIELIEEYRRM